MTVLLGFAASLAIGPAQAQSVTLSDLLTNLNQNCGPASSCFTAVEVALGWDSTLRGRDQTSLGEFLCDLAENNPAYAPRIEDLVEVLGTSSVDRAYFRNCEDALEIAAGDTPLGPPGGTPPPDDPPADDPPPDDDNGRGNNGVGNGEDPPPPGGGNEENDESGNGPGNPGGKPDTPPGRD